MKTEFQISGIHCDGCRKLIKDVAGDFAEIKRLDFTTDDGSGFIEHEDGFDVRRFESEIAGLGRYQITFR